MTTKPTYEELIEFIEKLSKADDVPWSVMMSASILLQRYKGGMASTNPPKQDD